VRRLLLAAIVCACACANATDVSAQEYGRQVMPFLEGTDVFVSSVGGTLFEANIFPHLVLWQNFTDAITVQDVRPVAEQPQLRAERVKENLQRVRWSISGTPAVRIRMFRQVSDPVRTPSYMPRVNLQMFWANVAGALERANQKRARPADPHPTMNLWEIHAIGGHHSNGQDGCFYRTQQRPAGAEQCEPPLAPDARTAQTLINKHDGSFSTNYVRVGLNYRLNWLDAHTLVAFRELSARVEVEQHPRTWMDQQEVDLYGRTRLNTSAAFAIRGWRYVCPSRIEARAWLNYISGAPSTLSSPWVKSAELSCFPTPAGGWGIFARYYTGQDYYNLGFLDDIHRWEIGATYNQDGFFKFRKIKKDEGE
jgi:hypothetical protein